MRILDSLQRRFGRYALPHVTETLIFCQVLTYGIQYARPDIAERMTFVPARVLEGEVWRLMTYLVEPLPIPLLFVLFFWYFFFLMGTALESVWGSFRYNVYLLTGYLATTAAAFLTPEAPAGNGFLYGSLFLAFAYLYPNFVIYIFFLLPVKIKWLALLQWIGYFWVLGFGGWVERIMVTASVGNFLFFFGKDIFWRAKAGRWRMVQQVHKIKAKEKPRHVCSVCGISNLDNPQMDFRYCSKCEGTPCYCEEHLRGHEHVMKRDAVEG